MSSNNSPLQNTRLTKAAVFFSNLDAILGDVFDMCHGLSSVRFIHVKRDGNTDHLARLVSFGVEQYWELHCPNDVAPYVLMDTLSMD